MECLVAYFYILLLHKVAVGLISSRIFHLDLFLHSRPARWKRFLVHDVLFIDKTSADHKIHELMKFQWIRFERLLGRHDAVEKTSRGKYFWHSPRATQINFIYTKASSKSSAMPQEGKFSQESGRECRSWLRELIDCWCGKLKTFFTRLAGLLGMSGVVSGFQSHQSGPLRLRATTIAHLSVYISYRSVKLSRNLQNFSRLFHRCTNSPISKRRTKNAKYFLLSYF